mmetsp:Transcript_102339/g.208239  ORF Transcript_102339/g.208239 Transcript_102339/m.208239 type:complete len:99 (-) Transcript_102339:12-308(-)
MVRPKRALQPAAVVPASCCIAMGSSCASADHRSAAAGGWELERKFPCGKKALHGTLTPMMASSATGLVSAMLQGVAKYGVLTHYVLTHYKKSACAESA